MTVMQTIEPDCTLATRVSSAIQQHPHLSRRNLKFEARDGRIILRGTVSTYYQKLMAQEALRRLDGVEEIENHLEVSWR
ncbi:MAG: BON domain-containing protein [Planctomycetota bacterium]|mgnify:CR=1 FL=1|nr:MAG: BON domain-containing protein [Planctomycetota bacterium]